MSWQFTLPTGAIKLNGANNLFTLPKMPGVLFKKVLSLAEARSVGGGIAVMTADGSQGIALMPKTEAIMGLPTHMNAGVLSSSVILDTPSAAKPVFELKQAKSLMRPFSISLGITDWPNVYGDIRFNNDTDEAKIISAYLKHAPAGKRWVNGLTPLPVGFKTLSGLSSSPSPVELTHLCAVVCKADYGVLHWRSSGSAGWMSTHVTLGKAKGPLGQAIDACIVDMPSDLKEFAARAKTTVMSSPLGESMPKIAIVSYWGGDSVVPNPVVQTGVAMCRPVLDDSTAGESIYIMSKQPRDLSPVACPEMTVGAVPGVPTELIKDIATWHRMAEATSPDTSVISQIPTVSTFPGGWDAYCQGFYVTDQMDPSSRKVVAAGVPVDPTALLNFNPSLSNRANHEWGWDLFYGGHASGDYATTMIRGIQYFYSCVEDEAKGA